MRNHFTKPSFVVSSILIIFTGHVEALPHKPAAGEAHSGEFSDSSYDVTQRTKNSPKTPQRTTIVSTSSRATNPTHLPHLPSSEREAEIPETTIRTTPHFLFGEGPFLSTARGTGCASINQKLRINDPAREDFHNVQRHRRTSSILPNLDMNKTTEPIMESSSLSTTKDSDESKSSVALRPLLKAESSRSSEEGQMSAPKLYSRKRFFRSSSNNERCRKMYETDGSWPEMRKMREQQQVKQLNGYASVVHANALQVPWPVSDAEIIEGCLELSDGGRLLSIDILCFSKKEGDKMYVARGTHRDTVYVLNMENDGGEPIFTLKEAVDVPRPVPPE